MDDTGSLTARLLEDVTSTPREGRHVWHIGLERIVEGTERGEAALEAEDARLCRILEGPVIGEQLDSIRDTACVQDFGSMQKVLTRVLRLLGEGSGRGEHPIPTAQNEPVVTLSELITFVSISPSEVWTVYYYLGVQARRYRQCPYIRRSLIGDMDISAISTGFPGNPH
jgi:hypothetical protein